MDEYTKKFTFVGNIIPEVGQHVILSRDLMGYGTHSDRPALNHNHGVISRIVPQDERTDTHTHSSRWKVVEVQLPDGQKIMAFDCDLTPII